MSSISVGRFAFYHLTRRHYPKRPGIRSSYVVYADELVSFFLAVNTLGVMRFVHLDRGIDRHKHGIDLQRGKNAHDEFHRFGQKEQDTVAPPHPVGQQRPRQPVSQRVNFSVGKPLVVANQGHLGSST